MRLSSHVAALVAVVCVASFGPRVAEAAPVNLKVTAPGAVTANAPFSVTVTLTDAFGNTIASNTDRIYISVNRLGAQSLLTTSGVVAFTNLRATAAPVTLVLTCPGRNLSTTVVVKAPSSNAPSFTTGSQTAFQVGLAGTFTVRAIGRPAPTFTTAGPLPKGVTLVDDGNGSATLAGTPNAGAGKVWPFTITATNGTAPDANQSFTLTVREAPAFTSADVASFKVGQGGTFSITTGFAYPTPAITRIGDLPAGVTFTNNGDGTATLTGTPAAGTGKAYPIAFVASNGVLPNAQQSFTLTVNEAPTITSTNGASFPGADFTVTTGPCFPAAQALSIGGATLPAGVTFTDNGDGTAKISGTPGVGTGGLFTFSITASNGTSPDASQPFTLTINEAPSFAAASDATTFAYNVAGTHPVAARGYPRPALILSGEPLPAGVTFTDHFDGTATLAGTPLLSGVYDLTITAVTNGHGPDATQSFTLTVTSPATITSFTPSSQGANQRVTIHGTTLSGATSVTFGGGPAGTITANTATYVTVIVPAGSASGDVTVTTPSGGPVNASGFTYQTPPDVTGVSAPAANATVSGVVPITYTIAQAQSLLSDVTVEFDASGLGTFLLANTRRCAQQGGAAAVEPSGVSGVTALAGGSTHTFSWNSTADLPNRRTAAVAVRVRASRSGVFGGAPSPVTGLTVANGVAFTAAASPAAGTTPRGVALADVNGDGRLDLLVAASNVSVLLASSVTPGAFLPAASYAAGASPRAIVAGDLDRDGKPDLVVANEGSGSISVLLANPASPGTFLAASSVAVGTSPVSVVIADVNRDGKPDVIAANRGSGDVRVLIGAGDGSFVSAASYPAAAAPSSIAVADVNKDGVLDLVVADSLGGSFAVLLGSAVAPGTFGGPASFTAGSQPSSIAVADLDADGLVDVIVANAGATSNSVTVHRGLAGGTFAAGAARAVGTRPASLVLADVNNDGKLNVVVANDGGGLSLLLGDGAATFQPALSFGAGTNPAAVVVGDVNRDGRADVLVANSGGDNVSVLLNTIQLRTNPLLAAPFSVLAGLGARSSAFADVNGDGKPDLVIAMQSSNQVAVCLGRGDGTFQQRVLFAVGTTPVHVAVADLNADGRLDVVTANVGGDVSVLLGDGAGSLGTAASVTAGQNPTGVAIGDMNGDGKPDLVVSEGGGGVSVLAGSGTGTFPTAVHFAAGTTENAVALGDLDGDGRLDVVVSNGGTASVSVLLGAGDGTLGSAVDFAADANPLALALGDLDGDFKLDIAVVNNAANKVTILHGAGDGTFVARAPLSTFGGPNAIALGDLNRDGTLDLLVTVAGPTGLNINNVQVYLGVGDATFKAPVAYGTSGPSSVALGDANGDGFLDVAVTNKLPSLPNSNNTCFVFLGHGDGTIGATTLPTLTLPSCAVLADLNGDGKQDLIFNNEGTQTFSRLLGNGDGTFAAAATTMVFAQTRAVVAGDLDRDGKVDVVLVTGTNNAAVFIGKGDGTFKPRVDYPLGGTNATFAVLGDFNRDGVLDLAVANFGSNDVSVLLGDAVQPGKFLAAAIYSLPASADPAHIAAGDLDGDGILDLVVANGDIALRSVSLFFGNGDGTFRSSVQVQTGTQGASSTSIADMNGDGKPDLMVSMGLLTVASRLLGNGDGTFAPFGNVVFTVMGPSGAVADMDGDGKPDFVTAGNANVGVSRNNGDATFPPAVQYAVKNASFVLLADLNRDGMMDVVTANEGSANATLLLGR